MSARLDILAVLAFRNEEAYLGNALRHLAANGVSFALIDNGSQDRSREIAESSEFRERLRALVDLPFEGAFSLERQLRLKEEIVAEFRPDWVLHCDADEIVHSYRREESLRDAIERADAEGADAVNCDEFVFLPLEAPYAPDIDGWQPIRSYYFFEPQSPRLIRAWKRIDGRTMTAGGHLLSGEVRLAQDRLALRHYIFRDQAHAFAKYAERKYDAGEVEQHGWHANRVAQPVDRFAFPNAGALERLDRPDDRALSRARPHYAHYWEWWRKETPIVVGGFYRSGTTLLRRMLDAHPNIHCGPELKFLKDFHGDYLDDPLAHGRFFTTARSYGAEDELLRLFGAAFVEMHVRAAKSAGKRRWADKNPENALYLSDFERILPDGFLFVHIVRDPLDALASLKEIGFPKTLPTDWNARVEAYAHFRGAGEAYCLAHPERSIQIEYESLVREPESALRALTNFLGEPYSERMISEFASPDRGHGLEDPKTSRSRSVHLDSIGRWRMDLTEDEIALARARLAKWVS
jgi:glycosyltransferase involved in cell wall biosynthesis